MKNTLSRQICKCISVVFTIALLVSNTSIMTFAADNSSGKKPFIVVSLGDSYASGEGNEEFYGQSLSLAQKVKNKDWLAHRSKRSWEGQLEFNNLKPLKKYKVDKYDSSMECNWFFVASSGAETQHMSKTVYRLKDSKIPLESMKGQKKVVYKQKIKKGARKGEYQYNDWNYLPFQMDVFKNNHLKGKVDYVTISLGGNDAGFGKIISQAAQRVEFTLEGETFVFNNKNNYFERLFEKAWEDWNRPKTGMRARLKEVYNEIKNEAGDQARIIVTGYPKLFNLNVYTDPIISLYERETIDENVTKINNELEKLIDECNKEFYGGTKHIFYADVEDEFDEHGKAISKHGIAYSLIDEKTKKSIICGFSKHEQNYASGIFDDDYDGDISGDDWLNCIMFHQDEDLDDSDWISAYSVHPNHGGVEAYRKCVQSIIDSLPSYTDNTNYAEGSLILDVLDAADGRTPVNAMVNVYQSGSSNLYKQFFTSGLDKYAKGHYEIKLPVGDYILDVSPTGYTDKMVNVTINRGSDTPCTVLMTLENDERSIIEGYVYNNPNGTKTLDSTWTGIPGAAIKVERDSNGDGSYSETVYTSNDKTDSNGCYKIALPEGTYKITASHSTYGTQSITNVKVKKKKTTNAKWIVFEGKFSGTMLQNPGESIISTFFSTSEWAWKAYDHPGFDTPEGYDKHIITQGDNIRMYGYLVEPYRDFLFVDDNNSATKVLTFDIHRDETSVYDSENNWHSMEGGGFLFNTKIDEAADTISGFYLLVTENGLELRRLDQASLSDFRSGYTWETTLETFEFHDLFAEHHLKLLVTENYISVWDGNNVVTENYALPKYVDSYVDTDGSTVVYTYTYGNGFGPLTTHKSHDCEQRSYFTFSNIKMQTM